MSACSTTFLCLFYIYYKLFHFLKSLTLGGTALSKALSYHLAIILELSIVISAMLSHFSVLPK